MDVRSNTVGGAMLEGGAEDVEQAWRWFLERAGHGDIVPTDQISLNFAKIEISYKPQKPDGTLGAATIAGWDVKANKKV